MKGFFRKNSGTLPLLALVLCLFQFLLSAAFYFLSARAPQVALAAFGRLVPAFGREKPADQEGVGGGTLLDMVISESDAVAALVEQTASLEEASLKAGVLEPESFSKPRLLLYDAYTVQKGDTIGDLAAAFGLNPDTLISANNIKNTRLLQIGQTLKIPNQDGIFYTVEKGDTLETIAEKYKTESQAIRIVNELFSDAVNPGAALFVPGGLLDRVNLQEINGDLFIWPIPGYITSPYGYRRSPFTGVLQFHSGLDLGSPQGTPVKAAMSGRVSAVGMDNVLGNYVVITHHSGYRTLYAHLSVIRVKNGAYVGTGERIGDVGSTGLSTGPHLHFTVYKNGVTVNPRVLMK